MSTLVDDMLLIARLDQGRPLEMKPVDLQAIARDAVSDANATGSKCGSAPQVASIWPVRSTSSAVRAAASRSRLARMV